MGLECGTGMWDSNVGLECGTGQKHGTRVWNWTGLTMPSFRLPFHSLYLVSFLKLVKFKDHLIFISFVF